ncbi:hypothetical protein DM02DRAFT_547200 [Periconia macrospinosa]|uniref:Zn(2)-C6 fungal-type domain-containing protein n=1 Tax=Periconia macrospinosa TaxID=97972 RepID=A0A2V1CYD5_9PLEO|nr:hypothetical protein DM02DRAFT_547200 [Periconia macrospinosa]
MSPPNHVEQPFHPPPTQPHYVPQPAGGYSAPPTYISQPYTSSVVQVSKKPRFVRATQACSHCRSRKQKCDEGTPCQFCQENNLTCQYKDASVPKQNRSMMQLQESVNSMNDTLNSFVENFNLWKQSVESRLPLPSSGDYNGVNNIKIESPIMINPQVSPAPTNVSTPIGSSQPPPTHVESEDHSQSSRGAPQEIEGLQSDHTTPAHMLLPRLAAHWNLESQIPDLKRLTDLGKPVTDYPMHYEQDRGLLRVWGVGEGHDSRDGVQGAASPASHNEVDVSSPASLPPRDGVFGPIAEQSSPSTMGGDYPTHDESVGGLGPDGKPDFRLATLTTLHKAYQDHIHVLHPFLNPYQLEKMIVEFGRVYSPEARATQTMSPATVPERLNITGLKRKRSNSIYESLDNYAKVPIERSLGNAIVLLVLALGKVCDFRGILPSPQYDKNPLYNGSYAYHRDSPRSANGSFYSEEGDTRQRNVDIIPGMAYFSAATDILGNQIGGNTVAHAQASILAALYLAQFARVLESWSWINNACRISLVLIKADYRYINRDLLKRETDNLNRHNKIPTIHRKERHRLNLIKVIYWTCLQLESDILAEMSTLPPTSITKYQGDIVYPEGVYEHAPDPPHQPEVGPEDEPPKYIYSSLISLRILLNGAHNSLYSAVGNPKNNIYNTAKTMVDIVKNWRGVLPSILKWDDKEPPSTDLNIARLRAKVYGAWYVVLRPVLFMALEKIKEPPPREALSYGNSLAAAGGPFAIPTAGARYTNRGLVDPSDSNTQRSELIELSHQCIEAAIQSTIAFDRVGAAPDSPYHDYVSTRKGRLIVTNILGTLHAQFGNMVVLAAVWNSPLREWLSYKRQSSLNEQNLRQLFRRTVAILDEMAANSPILRIDTEILRHIYKELGLAP